MTDRAGVAEFDSNDAAGDVELKVSFGANSSRVGGGKDHQERRRTSTFEGLGKSGGSTLRNAKPKEIMHRLSQRTSLDGRSPTRQEFDDLVMNLTTRVDESRSNRFAKRGLLAAVAGMAILVIIMSVVNYGLVEQSKESHISRTNTMVGLDGRAVTTAKDTSYIKLAGGERKEASCLRILHSHLTFSLLSCVVVCSLSSAPRLASSLSYAPLLASRNTRMLPRTHAYHTIQQRRRAAHRDGVECVLATRDCRAVPVHNIPAGSVQHCVRWH